MSLLQNCTGSYDNFERELSVYYILIFYFVCGFPFQVILGKVARFPTTLDEQLQKQLLDCSGEILTATGNTMCTHDFYEGKN